ncbi:MAG: DoxX family protein [Coxiellaceae bacterium]|nr:MAG: DoxX family protein [Coxiellaceae bacterium]
MAGLFIEIVAALMILLGWKARFGAFILVIYLLVITFAFHHFWDLQSVTEAQTEMHHFGKNLIIIGGLLYVMAFGPGKICLSQKERMMR